MDLNADDFESLLQVSGDRLLAVARRILRNDADAEDALQEAFISGWRARDKFDGRSSLDTWMHRIVVNTSVNRLKQRSAQTKRLVDESARPVVPTTPAPTDSLAIRELLWRAIDRLPEDQRVVLVLRDVEQFSTDQIADQLALSPAAVRQRLHRARKHAAEVLYPELCGAGDMTCGGRLDYLLDMIDETLADDVRTPVLEHVESCADCQSYAARYRRSIDLPRQTAESMFKVSSSLRTQLTTIWREPGPT